MQPTSHCLTECVIAALGRWRRTVCALLDQLQNGMENRPTNVVQFITHAKCTNKYANIHLCIHMYIRVRTKAQDNIFTQVHTNI